MPEANAPGADKQPKNNNKSIGDARIVLFNLLALAFYTVLCKTTEAGFIFDAFFIAIQVFVCLIMALAKRSWLWVLSGVLVLVIGFSTCVYAGLS